MKLNCPKIIKFPSMRLIVFQHEIVFEYFIILTVGFLFIAVLVLFYFVNFQLLRVGEKKVHYETQEFGES